MLSSTVTALQVRKIVAFILCNYFVDHRLILPCNYTKLSPSSITFCVCLGGGGAGY